MRLAAAVVTLSTNTRGKPLVILANAAQNRSPDFRAPRGSAIAIASFPRRECGLCEPVLHPLAIQAEGGVARVLLPVRFLSLQKTDLARATAQTMRRSEGASAQQSHRSHASLPFLNRRKSVESVDDPSRATIGCRHRTFEDPQDTDFPWRRGAIY